GDHVGQGTRLQSNNRFGGRQDAVDFRFRGRVQQLSESNRATLTRFVKAYIAGAYLARSDEAKAKEVIAQKFKTSDPKVIAATYADFKRLMPRDAAPSRAGAENVLTQLEAIGTDIGSRNPADYLDLGIIETLKQEGYFAQLEKTYPIKP